MLEPETIEIICPYCNNVNIYNKDSLKIISKLLDSEIIEIPCSCTNYSKLDMKTLAVGR